MTPVAIQVQIHIKIEYTVLVQNQELILLAD
jgi:hypothetical protein